MIFTSLSPNTERDDALLAIKLFLKPWSAVSSSARAGLQKSFSEACGLKNIYLTDSGRSALYLALKALNLKKGDEVLIQSFTCVAVPDPILWADLEPVFVDIEEDTLNMDPEKLKAKITKKSKVLIIQHTFGKPANIDELIKIARTNNLFIIEDCTHALGAKYKEQSVGIFGDMAFYSFGRDKVLSSVFGGALGTNNQELAQKINGEYEKFGESARAWVYQQIMHPIVLAVAKKSYNFLSLGKVILTLAKKLKIISLAVYPQEKIGGKPDFVFKKMPGALCEMALNQLKKLDRYNNHRRKIASYYKEQLTKVKGLKFIEDDEGKRAEEKSIFLRFAVKSIKVNRVFEVTKRAGIELGDWYSKGVAPNGTDYEKIKYNPNEYPVAEKVCKEIINLPTNINTSLKDAEKVVKAIKKAHE